MLKQFLAAELSFGENRLASRGKRLGASMIDLCILLIILGIFSYVGFRFYGNNFHTSFLGRCALSFVPLTLFFLLNYKYLTRYGQTVGKKILKIRIVTLDGKIPSIEKLFIRVFLFSCVSYLGFEAIQFYFPGKEGYITLFSCLDFLFIFRPDRRCIHDFLAKTAVIDIGTTSTVITKRFAISHETEKSINTGAFLLYKPVSRYVRLWGYLIDKTAFVITFVFLYYVLNKMGISAYFQDALSICGVFTASFLIVNSYFLLSNQQTLGKVFCGTKIVRNDGGKASFFSIFFCREFPFWGLWPLISGIDIHNSPYALFYPLYYLCLLLDILSIYREDRRCLHDIISRTYVKYI